MKKFWIFGTVGVIVSLCYKLTKQKNKSMTATLYDQLEREFEDIKYGC
jgi:hypothetical protein